MAKQNESIPDTILRVIAEAGGSISGTDLRDAMPDIADHNRRYHSQQLRKAGRISTTGNTGSTVYHLADGETASAPAQRIPNPKKQKTAKAPKRIKQVKVDRLAKRITKAIGRRSKPAPLPPPPSSELEDQHGTTVSPQYLRRVLALALARPGDIHDTDRQALAAVAAGC